jgi:hypothetical protein
LPSTDFNGVNEERERARDDGERETGWEYFVFGSFACDGFNLEGRRLLMGVERMGKESRWVSEDSNATFHSLKDLL